MFRPPAPDRRTRLIRAVALACAAAAALTATVLFIDVAMQDGIDLLDFIRAGLILATTAWLAWGAFLGFVGVTPAAASGPQADMILPQPKTIVLVPICNEDPVATFARIAAMSRSLTEAGVDADIAVLSDTRDAFAAEREHGVFARLLEETGGDRRIYYRRRRNGRGRKAGNVSDFIRRSGGAYEFALILDADSLMDGATIRALIARMQQDPRLGLLQTLPRIVSARSFFGRSMQFSAAFHGPVFTRGLARMQGVTGPFWGHNAIVRVRAFAESCGLPELSGNPPFGGHILSHDYVEAALLSRAGWKVLVDPTLGGSYEEGPENLLSYARRDRRWCQGNLQHIRLLFAPGFKLWSRFVFLQGIVAYLASLLWAGFLLASLAAAIAAPAPDYFPDPHQLFPVFPSDRTKEITALVLGVVGLLIAPKFAILAEAAATGRVRQFGGTGRALASVVTEILLSSILAPIMLLYQSRAVLQVLSGRDGGWPATARGEGFLTVSQAIRASFWVTLVGGAAYVAVAQFAPALAPWLLPVCLPMILAPLVIAWSSRPLTHSVFRVPEEQDVPPVVASYRAIHAGWARQEADPEEPRRETARVTA